MLNNLPGLYLVTDRSLCLHHPLEKVVEETCRAGVSVVQLREKETDTRTFLELAKKIHTITKKYSVPLLINDRLDICLALDAEGIHLGQSDLPWDYARKLLGPNKIIGLSCETKEEFLAVKAAEGLDYLALSPLYATKTKLDTKDPWGLSGLVWARSQTAKPLVVIGGIQVSLAKPLFQAGADLLAVVSAICSSENPYKTAETFLSFRESLF